MKKGYKFLIAVQEHEKEIICQKLKDDSINFLLDYSPKSWQAIDPKGHEGLHEIFVKVSDFDKAKLKLKEMGKEGSSVFPRRMPIFFKVINIIILIIALSALAYLCYYFFRELF